MMRYDHTDQNTEHVELTSNQHWNGHQAVNIRDGSHSDLRCRRLDALKEKLKTPPQILRSAAGRPTCSIFKVPASFVEVNARYYHPHIASIGPFHHGNSHLSMIQEHKYHYLSLLLSRTNLTLEDLFQTLEPIEDQARESYSEQIPFDCHEFLEILVVDGCFILELFRKVSKLIHFEHDDSILSMSWILPFLIRDLIRLENQIPFFVLQMLYDRTKGTSDREKIESASLVDISFEFFGYMVERPSSVVESLRGFDARHLLDLYRTSFIPADLESRSRSLNTSGSDTDMPSHFIHNVSKLRRAGIKIRTPKSDEAETFLAVRFLRNGVIEMPKVTIDDFMSSFFANCVAFELCHYRCGQYFTAYTTLLDCLINSAKDVEYMSEHNVIENYLGTEAELANFINSLGKEAAFDPNTSYLLDLFKQVNHYYENNWNVHWATFKHTYFSSPWTFISVLAAVVLLVLSVLQTLYSMIGYYHPPN
ncbi:hypothetical protein V2J09_006581 [Rumex salicifolius]